MKNPFTPNFGQVPVHIAGRSMEISEILHALDGNLGSPSRTSIFTGPRGCGKTALLTFLGDESEQIGWISVGTNCIQGMQEDILQQALYKTENLIPKNKGKHLTGVSVGNLFSVNWETENGVRPNWRMKLTMLLEKLEQYDTGLLITIDEINPKVEEMIQIASVYQLLIRENRKIAILMAGLPSKISSLLNDESVTFLRRACQYSLGPLEEYEVKNAFRRTVLDGGKMINDEALNEAAKAIDGHPYLLQLVGYRAWEASGEKSEILLDAVKEGVDLAKKDFETRVLKATVDELSDEDRRFLNAMLPDAAFSRNADVQERLGKSKSHLSLYKARLTEAGAIEPVGRGKFRFAIPGLKEYLEKSDRV